MPRRKDGPQWDRLAALIADEDGKPMCDPPDDCGVCTLLQRPDESWGDYLRRIGDLFKTSPDGHGVVRAS